MEFSNADSSSQLRVCTSCRDIAGKLGRAEVSKSYYCRLECLKADWKAGHEEYHVELEQKWTEEKQKALEDFYDVGDGDWGLFRAPMDHDHHIYRTLEVLYGPMKKLCCRKT